MGSKKECSPERGETGQQSGFDNSNRLRRLLRNAGTYGRMSLHMITRGVSAYDIVRTQFPLLSPRPANPSQITLEFTNYCDLKCGYCLGPRGVRELGMMHGGTFSRIIEGIKCLDIGRVRVVGGGEPTLHTEFGPFIRVLARSAHYLSVLSNGQWRKPHRIIGQMLEAPVDLIEVSVEGSDREGYENSNKRGKFSRLLTNLGALKRERDQAGSKSMIVLRVMVRPSDKGRERELREFWKPYGDVVLVQHLVRLKGLEDVDDLYEPVQAAANHYPKCSLPFKAMEVNWNGDVPLCCYSLAQYGPPGFMLGNVNELGLRDMWNGDILQTYRRAHRERICELMPICRGCAAI